MLVPTLEEFKIANIMFKLSAAHTMFKLSTPIWTSIPENLRQFTLDDVYYDIELMFTQRNISGHLIRFRDKGI